MINHAVLDELTKKISAAIPTVVTDLHSDIDKNIRAALQNTLSKLNLVTREEFEIQTKVLLATRQRLEELEKRVTDLENIQGDTPTGPSPTS